MSGRELTGRHVLAITVAAFGTIMAVNFLLAWKAVATFPGLEVKNSYVASQSFDRDRAAQEALGWDVSATVDSDALILTIVDPNGAPVQPETLTATLGRATHVADDRYPEFSFDGRSYVAPVELAHGYWNLRLEALSADGTQFRQRIELFVRPGT